MQDHPKPPGYSVEALKAASREADRIGRTLNMTEHLAMLGIDLADREVLDEMAPGAFELTAMLVAAVREEGDTCLPKATLAVYLQGVLDGTVMAERAAGLREYADEDEED
jgi:hypothetical protein